jgi:hypothetical protein
VKWVPLVRGNKTQGQFRHLEKYLTVMVLKGKKLHADGIQGIRGFAMDYKDLAAFTMT